LVPCDDRARVQAPPRTTSTSLTSLKPATTLEDYRSLRLGTARIDEAHPECKESIRLDLNTLTWTRGATFPLSMLEGRLKCRRCGSRRVVLLFNTFRRIRSLSRRDRCSGDRKKS
jgi:hypothetical protein